MYVTRTLSSLRNSPTSMRLPPEGPFSGVLVILDGEIEEQDALCCGLSDEIKIKKCPFPQSKMIEITFNGGDDHEYVLMIPVVGLPLSSNQYYAIKARFNRAGQAISCACEEDGMEPGCCIPSIKDIKPGPFDINNIYQQLKIIETSRSGDLHAESLVYNGLAPRFMRKGMWERTTASPTKWSVKLTEAGGQGLNALGGQLPGFDFPIGLRSPDKAVVGRWYVPFLFVKEPGVSLKKHMRRSTYYQMSLEQRWEEVFEAENVGGDMVAVAVDVEVNSEAVVLGGMVTVEGGGRVNDGGVMWFSGPWEGDGWNTVGLSLGILERMKWEQGIGGWVDVGGGKMRVQRVEEHMGGRGWKRFGCYMLVERYVLKRMDGSLVLSYDFYHIHQLKSKWEQV